LFYIVTKIKFYIVTKIKFKYKRQKYPIYNSIKELYKKSIPILGFL